MTTRLPGLWATAAVAFFGTGLGANAGCHPHGPQRTPPPATIWQVEAPRVDSLAALGSVTMTAGNLTLTRYDDGVPGWQVPLPVAPGPMAMAPDLVVVALAGTGAIPGLDAGLRGTPGAAIAGYSLVDGKSQWIVGVGSSEWVVVRDVIARADGFAIAGSFAGTLRVGTHVVTSAGGADGFWATLAANGSVQSVARMGGPGADSVAGIAELPGARLAVAGTYAGTAQLAASALDPLYADPDASDGFVAVLTADMGVAWSRTWGGPSSDSCAGLVATADGVAIAGTVRGTIDVAGRRLDTRGQGDGVIAYFDGAGAVRGVTLVGGDDFDGITALVGHGDTVVATGWFAGTIDGPSGRLIADGGDDPLIASVTPSGIIALEAVTADGIRAIAADETSWQFAAGSGDDHATLFARRW